MTRCPYCHVHVDDLGWVCADCVAKHHRECWSEHGKCATCSGGAVLTTRHETAPDSSTLRWIAGAGFVPTLFLFGLFAFCWVGLLATFNRMDDGTAVGLGLTFPIFVALGLATFVLARIAFGAKKVLPGRSPRPSGRCERSELCGRKK